MLQKMDSKQIKGEIKGYCVLINDEMQGCGSGYHTDDFVLLMMLIAIDTTIMWGEFFFLPVVFTTDDAFDVVLLRVDSAYGANFHLFLPVLLSLIIAIPTRVLGRSIHQGL